MAISDSPSDTTLTASCEMKSVRVDLVGRSYDVLIGPGLIERAGELIMQSENLAFDAGGQCAIVTDETVAGLHLSALKKSLKTANLCTADVILPPGEATKCFARLEPLCERLLELGVERGDLVIALGGGVIGDIAGFAASILRRGVRFVQIPTTLLAQVDSSVGGKTGINTPLGKNLIGTFHQPSLVIADTGALDTLDPRQLRAGYAEVVKYGLIKDASFYSWLENNWRDIFAVDGEARARAIETSCQTKAMIVAADEREAGERALLNLGHTFGHALEAWSGYSDRLLHGEAVAIGMVLAFQFSEELKLCPKRLAQRVEDHLKAIGLPVAITDIPGGTLPEPDGMLTLMAQDKKVQKGRPAFILVHDIGEAFVARDIPEDKVRAFLSQRLKRP